MRALTDFGKAFVVTWGVLLGVAALAMMVLGCAVASVQTNVRRADSLADVDRIGDEAGREGWRIVDVVALQGGWSYVVVMQREAVQP